MSTQFQDRFANYASAGLRWGLLLEDHPDAHRTYYEVKGSAMDEPFNTRWGDKTFVVCQIEIPGHADLHVGVKEVPVKVKRRNGPDVAWENTWDNYSILQTQACGRALRSAGYPHSIPDLKLVMLWRQRNAEVESLMDALDAAGEVEDDEEDDENGDHPPATRQVGVGHDHPQDRPRTYAETKPIEPPTGADVFTPTGDVMAPLLADDAVRSMWDQMIPRVQDELRAWMGEQTRKPGTVRAYMKYLLDREHAAMKEEAKAGDPNWVERAVTTINGPKAEPAPPEPADEALLEGIAEMRERLKAIAQRDAATYAHIVSLLSHRKITMSDRLTMEQLIEVDEVVSEYEPEDAS